MMESFRRLMRIGNYSGAFRVASLEKNPLKRVAMITELIEKSRREEFLPELTESAEEIKDVFSRAIAESYVGRALYSLEREKEAEERFATALELSKKVRAPWKAAEVLGAIGRNFERAGLYSESLKCYRKAADMLQASRSLYSETVSVLMKLADMMEKSGDNTPNEKTLEFYELAAELYRSVNFNVQAREVEEKKELCREVMQNGIRTVAELLERGEVIKAIEVSRFLEPPERCAALLNISYWLFLHDEPRLARETFKMAVDDMLVGKFRIPDVEIEKIAYRLLRIGLLEEPLILAGIINDSVKAAEIIGEVAVGYAKRGESERALSIASGIKNPDVKRKAIEGIMKLRT